MHFNEIHDSLPAGLISDAKYALAAFTIVSTARSLLVVRARKSPEKPGSTSQARGGSSLRIGAACELAGSRYARSTAAGGR
jgi:hypothetical protein